MHFSNYNLIISKLFLFSFLIENNKEFNEPLKRKNSKIC